MFLQMMMQKAQRRMMERHRTATITALIRETITEEVPMETMATETTPANTIRQTPAKGKTATTAKEKDMANMDKIDFIFNDRWIKDKVRFWLNCTISADERRAVAYGLLESIATQYAVLTYYDGNDLYVLAHGNLEKCITISRNADLQDFAYDLYWMGNGGLYVKHTPVEVKSAIERAMGRVSEDADNRAAKKSCALH